MVRICGNDVTARRSYDQRMAYLCTSPTLYDALSKRRSMRIGWTTCRVDCSVVVSRCSTCRLLGHSAAKCSGKLRTSPLPENRCIDCIYYNTKSFWEKLRKNAFAARQTTPLARQIAPLKKRLLKADKFTVRVALRPLRPFPLPDSNIHSK